MSYFTGFVTGPRKTPCPPGCSDWKRFGLAIQTSLYHEVAVMVTMAFLVLISWEEPNQAAQWTFVVLWLMRWSAKLNLFFGVPNLNEDWLPEHLRYLKTYMCKRGMNLLFPLSVTGATVVDVLIVFKAMAPETTSAQSVALILVATLLALAILEHWLLVLPLPDEALWAWALPKPERTESDSGDPPPSSSDQTASSVRIPSALPLPDSHGSARKDPACQDRISCVSRL